MGVKQRRIGSMYFDNFIKMHGEGFMSKETPVQLKRKANMLFRDIAFGNITDKYLGYFTNNDFVSLMYSESSNIQSEYWIHKIAMEALMEKYPPDDRMKMIYMKDSDKYTIYTIISEGFYAMSQCLQLEYVKTVIAW